MSDIDTEYVLKQIRLAGQAEATELEYQAGVMEEVVAARLRERSELVGANKSMPVKTIADLLRLLAAIKRANLP